MRKILFFTYIIFIITACGDNKLVDGITFGSLYKEMSAAKVASTYYYQSNIVLSSHLKGSVKDNFKRFLKMMPSNSKESAIIRKLEDGNYLFEAVSPGKIYGSKAVYQKIVDPKGKTLKMIKTTYDPSGNVVHIKRKY